MWASVRMNGDHAIRRLRNLRNVVNTRPVLRHCVSDSKVTIGDVSIGVKTPHRQELVPRKFLPAVQSQTVLKHLRWMMQKDALGQDMFLIGSPGPLRRHLAMMYLEMTKREAEYVALSRDTTETDLKQRREIQAGTAYHIDQCAVRAATSGGILILEGIEKAERNVLPVLNNLLENREMQLDDGRFLVHATRYDKLLQDHTKEELDSLKLVRVDEDFRVIALGLPVPRYQGNPLDPPLRSRFQARDINPLPFKELLDVLYSISPDVSAERLSMMLSFATTMRTQESQSLGLPDFPLDNLPALAQILNATPSYPEAELITRLYPYERLLNSEGQAAVKETLKTFDLVPSSSSSDVSVMSISRQEKEDTATVELKINRDTATVKVPCGSLSSPATLEPFVKTPYHERLLFEMMQSHMVKDFCIMGPRGCGKSAIVKHFADLLGYHIEPIMLYQDMTSRDLLQQRTTLPNGDTTWRMSPLVTAALDGSLAVLDGVHRINPGTFAVLHRLVHDRELSLFDGSQLLRKDKYDTIKQELSLSDEEMTHRAIFPIHPSFRIMALSEPPVAGSSNQQWLSSELLTMFLYHDMRALDQNEDTHLLHRLVPSAEAHLKPLLQLTHRLRSSHDNMLLSLASSLSTRQLLRIARRLDTYAEEDLYSAVHKACLARFLPRTARSALEQVLEDVDIVKESDQKLSVDGIERAISSEVKGSRLRIGQTEVDVHNPENKTKVPDVLFYDNAQHLAVMEDMLKDFMLGEHLLLVGNQGVGKNKIVDRFLYLLNRPREYLQLHRDTTVQNLTLQPTVLDGIISYEDSPLVRAVKNGHILVVDEADKAPTNVTCILKTLVESGEMHLSDGRRIVSAKSNLPDNNSLIRSHPDFRMIVLANRPGFPFLGNDFFGAMGDIFSCHAIDNPDVESELAMLRQYGPTVSEEMLGKLVKTFGDLRDMADQGLINYPYSTREVVNMVKHLEKFPSEGLANVVRNVFDFDSYSKETHELIVETLHKHGIPVGARKTDIHMAKIFPIPTMQKTGSWMIDSSTRRNSSPLTCPVEQRKLRIKGPVRLDPELVVMDRFESRSLTFTEQEANWLLPLHEHNIIADVAVTQAKDRVTEKDPADLIHVVTAYPINLFSMTPKSSRITSINLADIFRTTRGVYRPKLSIAALGAPLEHNVIVHEEMSNIILNVDTSAGWVSRLHTASLLETAADKLVRRFQGSNLETFRMCKEFSHLPDSMVVFYKMNGGDIDIVNVAQGTSLAVSVPIRIKSMNLASPDKFILTETKTDKKFVLSRVKSEMGEVEFVLSPVTEDSPLAINMMTTQSLSDDQLGAALGEKISCPNRLFAGPESYAGITVGFPELTAPHDIYTIPRTPLPEANPTEEKDPILGIFESAAKPTVDSKTMCLPETGLIITGLPAWKVPKEVTENQPPAPKNISGYLEVVDPVHHQVKYVPVPGPLRTHVQSSWQASISDSGFLMSGMSNDGLMTVDSSGCVRLWEMSYKTLEKSLGEWQQMMGGEWDENLKLEYDDLGSDVQGDAVEEPKHGKVDPTGAPHVGGNTWAGGVGGRDTAGLGGVGGPYRLDGGNPVHQVSDEAKAAVPLEVQKAAREMAQKAFKQRMKEIQMSEYDADIYEQYAGSVRRQVQALRVILDSLHAKGKERQWVKHQTDGDLDDAKLIEGITGERGIYKKRAELDPELGSPQQKPKRLKLVVDVSGSMYRFNSHDGRLEREMEAILMVMEAFEKYEHKFKYDIVGHSGDDFDVKFVKPEKVPANNKERLDILRMMHAHSQFCWSGDHTIHATKHAIESIAKEEADERFVIILSDANFDRYGIPPKKFAEILTSDEEVNAYAIFIGSLGDQATRLSKQLPSGKAFVCLDTKTIPQILQQIFTASLLSTR
ncbi:von Willebrand factor A domain-containing protein 8-like [Lineus longissimus]|uniref:von Willebrand factor A domain-containing protein 8-like n=1 Tax=Lineus longissimus TaxID=88925 RepID=UPI002B4F8510